MKDTRNKTYSRNVKLQREPRLMNIATCIPKCAVRNPHLATHHSKSILLYVAFAFGVLLFLTACGGDRAVKPEPLPQRILTPMGYTIQVGAFSNMSNAVRLTDKLQTRGLNAYHFLHDSGLYKVRFGNYATEALARRRAENLAASGIIEDYYIVAPDEYAAAIYGRQNSSAIRENLVKTALHYIGVPYRWGGQSPDTGFDCSGLTMVVYQLNGFDLPRSSRQQWKVGSPVKRSQLLKGDLVFFATSGGKRVSHVGIYLGGGNFLHAPGRGRKIKSADMSDVYFKKRYMGARSYL